MIHPVAVIDTFKPYVAPALKTFGQIGAFTASAYGLSKIIFRLSHYSELKESLECKEEGPWVKAVDLNNKIERKCCNISIFTACMTGVSLVASRYMQRNLSSLPKGLREAAISNIAAYYLSKDVLRWFCRSQITPLEQTSGPLRWRIIDLHDKIERSSFNMGICCAVISAISLVFPKYLSMQRYFPNGIKILKQVGMAGARGYCLSKIVFRTAHKRELWEREKKFSEELINLNDKIERHSFYTGSFFAMVTGISLVASAYMKTKK